MSAAATPLRLALADDQALVRSGLAALLGSFSQLQVVVQAGDGGALLAAIEHEPVDVILSDIRMPGLDGFGVLDALRAAGNPTPVILLTTFDEPDLTLRAAECGARGFLLKDASPEDLLDAVTRVAAGDTLLAPVSTDPVRARYAYRDTSEPTESSAIAYRNIRNDGPGSPGETAGPESDGCGVESPDADSAEIRAPSVMKFPGITPSASNRAQANGSSWST